MSKKYKCKWCNNKATRKDYREIDGVTSKILTCDKCFTIPTKELLNKYLKNE